MSVMNIKILFTDDTLRPLNFKDVGDADIVVIPGKEKWYVYKNKITGVKGDFPPVEFTNLLKEALNGS